MSVLSTKMDILSQTTQLNAQSFAQQLADVRVDHNDHEARLRVLESRQVVTPKSMWTAISIIVAVAGVIVAIISIALG